MNTRPETQSNTVCTRSTQSCNLLVISRFYPLPKGNDRFLRRTPLHVENMFLFSHSVHTAMCGHGKQQHSPKKSQTSPSSLHEEHLPHHEPQKWSSI